MVSLLIRLLALLGLLWTGKHVVNQVSSVFHSHQNVDGKASEGEIAGEMVKDPVCQTYIPKSIAFRKMINGETHYFCSEECASKFLQRHQSET
jgi:YHS domain-containing protein